MGDVLATKAEKRAAAFLRQYGSALVPVEVSWRIADKMKRFGWVTLDPHYQRWLGRIELTDDGRRALSGDR